MTHIPEKVSFHRTIVITREYSINVFHTYPEDLLSVCEFSVVVPIYTYIWKSVLENYVGFLTWSQLTLSQTLSARADSEVEAES